MQRIKRAKVFVVKKNIFQIKGHLAFYFNINFKGCGRRMERHPNVLL